MTDVVQTVKNDAVEITKLGVFQNALAELAHYKTKLAVLLKTDYAKVKTDLEALVTHFEAEVTKLKADLHPVSAAAAEAGAPPPVAHAQASIPVSEPVADSQAAI